MSADNQIILGDCLEIMKTFRDDQFDLVLTDPPYGYTTNEWDTKINWGQFWEQVSRIADGRAIIFSSQPFTTTLINSNPANYKYSWIWNKGITGNFALAKIQPLKTHEEICIFGKLDYAPIMRKGRLRFKGNGKGNENTGGLVSNTGTNDVYYPTSILDFSNAGHRSKSLHPTQKPVELMRYLVQTYTKEGMNILDPFAGSGSTLRAAKDLNRKCTVIEINPKYVEIIKKRERQEVLL